MALSCCGDLSVYLQLQASFVISILGIGWLISGINRRATFLRLLMQMAPMHHLTDIDIHKPTASSNHMPTSAGDHNCDKHPSMNAFGSDSSPIRGQDHPSCHPSLQPKPFPFSHQTSSQDHELPLLVSVVLPVKGIREHSRQNWISHLMSAPSAPNPAPNLPQASSSNLSRTPFQLEFIFVVESANDPAHKTLRSLVHQASKLGLDGKQDSGGIERRGEVMARICLSGPASTCGQKVHNLCVGVEACSERSTHVLFLDDDVELHPFTILDLVNEMVEDPSLFLVTGYPFDIPPPPPPPPPQPALQVCLSPLSTSAWAMTLVRSLFIRATQSVWSIFYSMFLSDLPSYCALVYHLPLLIAFSVSKRTSFVWGGCVMMRRVDLVPSDKYGILRAFRDGGYSDDMILGAICNKHGLKVGIPARAILPQRLERGLAWRNYLNYIYRQLYVLDTYVDSHNRLLNLALLFVHSFASLSVALGFYSFLFSSRRSVMFLLTVLFAHSCLYFMTSQVLNLLHLLADPRDDDLIDASSEAIRERRRRWRIQIARFNWIKVWLGLIIESSLVPLLALVALITSTVEWGGIRYRKERGKVKRVAT